MLSLDSTRVNRFITSVSASCLQKKENIYRKSVRKISLNTTIGTYFEVHGAGERSSVGVKRMITARLNKLIEADDKQNRIEIIDELNELVYHLYSRYKSSQQKLDEIRSILNQ